MPSGALLDKLSSTPQKNIFHIKQLHLMLFGNWKLMNQLSDSNFTSLSLIIYTLSSQTYCLISTFPSSPFKPDGLIKRVLEINLYLSMLFIKIELKLIAFHTSLRITMIRDFPNLESMSLPSVTRSVHLGSPKRTITRSNASSISKNFDAQISLNIKLLL